MEKLRLHRRISAQNKVYKVQTLSAFWKVHQVTIDCSPTGEESLTIFLDKQKLNKKSEGSSNSSVVSLELLHQLAASYFTDRESTLRRLHHLQIATSAIKVMLRCMQVAKMPNLEYERSPTLALRQCGNTPIPPHSQSLFSSHMLMCVLSCRPFTNSDPSWPAYEH